MATRLLAKQDIAKQKSIERKNEVDEGIKLAKRVDVLRETVAQESEKLAKFRIETLRIIQEEINKKIEEKNVLNSEILQCKQELNRMKLLIETELPTIIKEL